MNAEDLFRAIGQAENADLEHSEMQKQKHRKLLPRLGIIAAVIAVLCMTAMAIPSVRNLLFGVKVQQNKVAAVNVVNGDVIVDGTSAGVLLDVTIPEDAPKEIKTAYVPLFAAEHWKPIVEYRTEGIIYEVKPGNYLGWEDDRGNYALFNQLACPGYSGDHIVDYIDLGFNAAYEITALQLGDEKIQCITVKPSSIADNGVCANDAGRKKIFWSDGIYLFSMEVNFDLSDAMLDQLYESVTPVDNIDQYRKIEYLPAS